jgi:hypothetical protein
MNKQDIIALFQKNVRGVEICLDGNVKHCGKEGYWLEKKMGIPHNSKNEPDIYGYEMKTGENVTTFIDKAPTYFLDGHEMKKRDKKAKQEFWEKYASKKTTEEKTIGGWKINQFNACGQKIVVENDTIAVLYDSTQDTRETKVNQEPHIIMQWDAAVLKRTIENKFNKNGFFQCKKIGKTYEKICFGKNITFDTWIAAFKEGIIYHDGYSKLHGRGRHVFRASNKFWDNFIIEEY